LLKDHRSTTARIPTAISSNAQTLFCDRKRAQPLPGRGKDRVDHSWSDRGCAGFADAARLVATLEDRRSPEFPGCEARNARVELARQEFGDTLREHLLRMIDAGEIPRLYPYEDLEPSFAVRCTVQIPAPDRMPGTLDRVMAVRAKLPPEAAQRLKTLATARTGEPLGGPAKPEPIEEAEPAPDTSAQNGSLGKLGPSARLALVAARLAGRDRNLG
jgi:hypothetical protein